jgi:hypothetical protein
MKGSESPGSPQFQRQMSVSQSEGASGGPSGDHLFKARFGFAQMKPEDEEKYELVAMQTIILVYSVPKDALTADVLTNVIWQFCTHTSIVVEQPVTALPRMQFFAQASASVIVAPPAPEVPPLESAPPAPPFAAEPPAAVVPPVAKAPPVPPVAEAPPVAEVPPVADAPPEAPPAAPVVPPVPPVLLLLQAQTHDAMPITNTSGPILFFNMSFLNYLPRWRLADDGIRRKKGFETLSWKSRTLIERLQAAGISPDSKLSRTYCRTRTSAALAAGT